MRILNGIAQYEKDPFMGTPLAELFRCFLEKTKGKAILFPDFSRRDQSNFASTIYDYILWETEQISVVEHRIIL